MQEMFADLHIHIGRSEKGKPIKITAARSLNFANIARECADRKGIQIAGIIDCASPYVIEDIEEFLETGEAYEIADGGIIYKDKVCIILGSEIETAEVNEDGKTGSAHNLCYFPTLKDIKAFSKEMSNYINNITLSSQRARISAYQLIDIVERYNGILIPAHCFTPHKSFYGNCTSRLERIFKEKFNKIFAIELGLSSDTELADYISELETRTFVTNSDAHSLPKIAREYNKVLLEGISFKELVKALKNEDGRKIVANYGMDPKLGKYHRTYCEACDMPIEGMPPINECQACHRNNITMGVLDRIMTIADKRESKSPKNRPPYVYQVPLTFVPGLGAKTIEKLLNAFETEMNILHKLSEDDIEAVVGQKVAKTIVAAREGKVHISSGGGGVYGHIEIS
ncbi:MAG: TIGR00375 family protein [Clostridia bacterium]|nr:TIGR00375 family protein [Clostridia bacterium]MCI9413133.1 TIGR00375 family protein [Clostridia bacterium]